MEVLLANVTSSGSGDGLSAECLDEYFPCSSRWTGNIFLVLVYAGILSYAAKVIADGSELLLDVMHPGVIGGLVIPMLGALPDATIIFVSIAVGDLAHVQEQIGVGMGTLSGSTIMLLTIAWVGGLILGRCDIVGGKSIDRRLTRKFDILHTGITTLRDIRYNAMIMVATTLPYFIVEAISFIDLGYPNLDPVAKESREDDYVMAAFVITCVFFVTYSVYMVFNTTVQDRRMKAARRRLIMQKMADMFVDDLRAREQDLDAAALATATHQELTGAASAGSIQATEATEGERVPLNAQDLQRLATRLVNTATTKDLHDVVGRWKGPAMVTAGTRIDEEAAAAKVASGVVEEEEEEEEGEKLSKPKLILKSVLLLAVGTGVVVLFSDPMVDTITRLAKIMHIPPFFISFVVTPFASNASELVASLYFCSKKSAKSVSIAMAAVYGAVTMNSTLNLGIFLIMMWVRDIYWRFSSECIPMLITVIGVGILASIRDTFTTLHAIIVFCLYPLSLGLVALLQYVGLDRPAMWPSNSTSSSF